MNQPQRILLTTDLSPTSRAAIAPAVMLARTWKAWLLLVHVGEPAPMPVGYPGLDVVVTDRHQHDRAEAELEQFAREHLPSDVNVERIVALGVPHLEIVRIAQERKADLIVMATHGRGFFSHAVMGSTTERVLRHAPCPVLAVREQAVADHAKHERRARAAR